MSGIVSLYNLDGAPVAGDEVARMASLLARRGPDRTGIWCDGSVGLGHTLLATTPELRTERQPLIHAASGCAISADVRLDNRDELLDALGLADQAATLGDAALIVAAYLAWGEACVTRLLGDFAFVLWDPRRQLLFCARDPFGMRPLYYHHSPGRFVALASEPRAILVLPQTPYRLNEARIADFLVSQLEGIDHHSTFFAEVYRLPPAHALVATPANVRVQRTWTLEPGPELRLPSDAAYAEAFLDVFTQAVQCRLSRAGPVGAMLSGGMDSGAVAAVARGLLAADGQGPLPTFSAVGPDPATCVETRTIHIAQGMEHLEPHAVNFADLDPWLPELADLSWDLAEPFDNHMTLPRAVYLAGRRHGCRVMLDGVAGDVVLSEGTYLARLLLAGRWWPAYREMVEQDRFYGGAYPAHKEFMLNLRWAFMPGFLRCFRRAYFPPDRRKRLAQTLRDSLISPEFAARSDLLGRLAAMDRQPIIGLHPDLAAERCHVMGLPFLVVGRDRYDRAAAAQGIETRDPFLDRRVVEFCMSLPGDQKLGRGYPKVILRRALAGRLPDAVCTRRGKQHLGWSFTQALMGHMQPRLRSAIDENRDILAAYVDVDALDSARHAYFEEGDPGLADRVFTGAHLATWLRRVAVRPVAEPSTVRLLPALQPQGEPHA